MRLLPVRPDHVGHGAAREQSEADGQGTRRGDVGERVPLRPLPPHPSGDQAGGPLDRREDEGGLIMITDRVGGTAPVAVADRGLSRRTVLTAGAAAGGGLLIGFRLLPATNAVAAPEAEALAPNAFVRIEKNGRVTVISPSIEMGQGTYTSLSMLIAEELEVDLAQVNVEHAPPNDKLYANPALGFQVTGGSTSIRGFWKPLRAAGAAPPRNLGSPAARSGEDETPSFHARK